MATPQSSILYKNPSKTLFLLDIPASITLAQDLSPTQHRHHHSVPPTQEQQPLGKAPQNQPKCILSTAPLQTPYPTLPEPKTEKARARVLKRIPIAERTFHADVIGPVARNGLEGIRQGFGPEGEAKAWCFERCVCTSDLPFAAGSLAGVLGGLRGDDEPPVILSPTCENVFGGMAEVRDTAVKNSSMESASLAFLHESAFSSRKPWTFTIPPLTTFLFCTVAIGPPPLLPYPDTQHQKNLIPGLPGTQTFNLILLDPPWPNRSVLRSGHYHTQTYMDMDVLIQTLRDILRARLWGLSPGSNSADTISGQESIAAIWVTNSPRARKAAYDAIQEAGLVVSEEWIWLKTTINGEPITPVDGLWRKPYEILVIGQRKGNTSRAGGSGDYDGVTRRVVAAVPDVHSRKPNLREIFEEVFFDAASYSALEVFARNLTAGWWACGDEVLRFNADEWWVDSVGKPNE